MHSSLSKKTIGGAFVAIGVLAIAVLVLLYRIPAVQGIGNKVKLPLFHGASTWVDLMIFTLMGVAALIYLIRPSDSVYSWEVGFRAVAAPLWAINSVLGFVAALSTWDFSGSKESPLVIIPQDPRLSAQIVLLLGVVIVIALDWLVFERRRYKALADLLFVVLMWVLLANVFLDPVKRALHPDSPVLNSGWEIRGPFFAIVAATFAVTLIASWLVCSTVKPSVACSEMRSDMVKPEGPAIAE
jgi:hypothetical protein